MRPISANPSKNTIFAMAQGPSDIGRKEGQEGGKKENERKEKEKKCIFRYCFQSSKGIFESLVTEV